MNYEMIFSFLGSAVGCVAGILASQKLTNYRLEQLEAKVAKHNNLVERMTVSELRIKMLEDRRKGESGYKERQAAYCE
jgi:hypothetical protein